MFLTFIIMAIPKHLKTPISTLYTNAVRRPGVFTKTYLIEFITQLKELLQTEATLGGQAKESTTLSTHNTDIKCFNCDKKGHQKADCRAKGGGQAPGSKGKKSKGGKSKVKEKAHTTKNEDKSSDRVFTVQTDFSITTTTKLTGVVCILNSGASHHFEPCHERFTTFWTISPKKITSVDGHLFSAISKGDVKVTVEQEGKHWNFTLKDVLFTPNMPFGLILISHLTKAGYQANFSHNNTKIIKLSGKTLIEITESGGLWPVKGEIERDQESLSETEGDQDKPTTTIYTTTAPKSKVTKMTLIKLHCHMGHTYPECLIKMVNTGVVTGIELVGPLTLGFCETCAKAKHAQKSFLKEHSSPVLKEYSEIVHTDIWGPVKNPTAKGEKFYISYINDTTDKAVLKLVLKKSAQAEQYQHYEAWLKKHQNIKGIKTLHSDHGGEYISDKFKAHLQKEGTEHHMMVYDSPQSNGITE